MVDKNSPPAQEAVALASAESVIASLAPDVLQALAKALAPMMANQLRNVSDPNVRKMFEVEPFLGSRTVIEKARVPLKNRDTGEQEKDEKGRLRFAFEDVTRIVTGGFLVFFPQGHAIYIESQERLNALGLNAASGLVNMSTGLPAVEDSESIKDNVRRNTQHTPRSRRGTGNAVGIDLDTIAANT